MSMATAGRIKKLELSYLELKEHILSLQERVEALTKELSEPIKPPTLKKPVRQTKGRNNGQRSNR